MKKVLILAFVTLSLSSVGHAAMTGTWHAALSYDNKSCDAIDIEIGELNNELTIKASGDSFIKCGDSAFLLDESYGIQGTDLYKYDIKMGSLTDTTILGKERSYDVNGYWRFWNFIQFTQNADGSVSAKLNFGDEYTLSGTLKK